MARRRGHTASRPEGPETADAGHGTGPVRTCIVSRAEGPPDRLIRFVLDPAGGVVPDIARRLPGRGVWVTLDRVILAEAVKRRTFNRAFRREVTVAADLVERVDGLLARRATEALSIANKAGLVTTGFESVHRGVETEGVLCVLHASDAAADGSAKIDRKLRAISRDRKVTVAILTPLTIDQLSLAIGRSPVVHALVGTGRAGENFVRTAERLIRYRSGASQSLREDNAVTGGDREAAVEDAPHGE